LLKSPLVVEVLRQRRTICGNILTSLCPLDTTAKRMPPPTECVVAKKKPGKKKKPKTKKKEEVCLECVVAKKKPGKKKKPKTKEEGWSFEAGRMAWPPLERPGPRPVEKRGKRRLRFPTTHGNAGGARATAVASVVFEWRWKKSSGERRAEEEGEAFRKIARRPRGTALWRRATS